MTGGGFGANTEANVIVRGHSRGQFFVSVKRYLHSIYSQADPLNRAFIRDYRVRSTQFRRVIRAERLGRGPRPTPLPTLDENSNRDKIVKVPADCRFWKVAPGFDGEDWPRWENAINSEGRGFVAIGWSRVGDLRDQLRRGWEDFSRYFRPRVREHYDSDPNYATRQLWTFGTVIRRHDIVVAYSKRTIFGLAEVSGGYRFDDDLAAGYCHTRPVRWLSLEGTSPPGTIMSRIATNRTVSPIENPAVVEYLRRTFLKRVSFVAKPSSARLHQRDEGSYSIAFHFRGKRGKMKSVYEHVESDAMRLGRDVTIYPRLRFIAFRRKLHRQRFAAIHVFGNRLEVALVLGSEDDPRLVPASSVGWARGKQRFTHVTRLSKVEEVDGKVWNWLKTSYDNSAKAG